MLNRFLSLIGYKVTEGSEFCWECYGPDSRMISFWDQDQNGVSAQAIFNPQNQIVYELNVCDFSGENQYRWIDPKYIDAHRNEAERREANYKQAWDGTEYTDLEVIDDFYEKAAAILAGEEYDARMVVPIEVTDEILFELMKMAHNRDITLNKLIEELLRDEVARIGV